MAYIAPRKNKAGEITSYQVKWRLGGARDGDWQTERFDDEDQAEVFRKAVDDFEQQWPPGWVKGQGYIVQGAGDEKRFIFRNYALESVKNRTGIEERYRDACVKELETYILPTFANCDIRSTDHFSKATISAWQNKMAQTKVHRGRHPVMSPKTLKNLRGLLSSILLEAVKEEPPLRDRNPCDLVALPRTDDEGVEDDDEDMTFLEPSEVEGIAEQFDRLEDRKLVRVKYATGFRWGEITALAKRHALNRQGEAKKLRVTRAWKRSPEKGHYLGKPKSKRSRRTIRVPKATWGDLTEIGLDRMNPNDLIFHNGKGERLPYSTFYDRWVLAVQRAHEAGTLSPEKNPTLHDLRHSHAAALLSHGRHSLTYVQRRLGHESITTTSDRYGHLLPEADDDAMETIEANLAGQARPGAGGTQRPAPVVIEPGDPRRVYAVHFGAHVEGFWDLDHARIMAGQWKVDKDEEARIEAWTVDWWHRSVAGGQNRVHHHLLERVEIWSVGPAIYAADGTEEVRRPESYEPRARWMWPWEELFTEEAAVGHAQWRPQGETEASAWGTGRAEVLEAFAQARTDALRVCGLNPAAKERPALEI
ncbi:site-specific integrase [Streptomyces roseifaciens]